MPFSLRSSLATASNCFWRPGTGSVWPRWVIQPVPVYSQYMSISPDSSALRAAAVPARPVWSLTVVVVLDVLRADLPAGSLVVVKQQDVALSGTPYLLLHV